MIWWGGWREWVVPVLEFGMVPLVLGCVVVLGWFD